MVLTIRHIPRAKRMGIAEEDFVPVEHSVDVRLEKCALVLIDAWDRHHITSHHRRCEVVIDGVIAPLLEKVRETSMCVIHAPGPEVAWKYPQCADYDRSVGDQWLRTAVDSIVPRKPLLGATPAEEAVLELRKKRRIAAALEPLEDELVIANQEQLSECVQELGLSTVFFAGFAANICLPYRDYGMRAVHGMGCEVVMLRDATTAVEVADTVGSEKLLAAAIADVELNFGYSALSPDLTKSLEG